MAGFTMAELMIAIAVLSIGLSGVAASLYFGFSRSNAGDDLATAGQYSRMVIELIKGRNYLDLAPKAGNGLPTAASGVNDPANADPVPLADPPLQPDAFLAYNYEDGEDGAAETAAKGRTLADLEKYTRKVQVERVSNTAGTPEFNLIRLTVTIYWEEKGVEKSVATTAIVSML
jgi:prepilin-type N-terminal cleavage/methylation domain-containing protein